MPIFVKGEVLNGVPSETRDWPHVDGQLTDSFTDDNNNLWSELDPQPYPPNTGQVVDLEAKEALDFVRNTVHKDTSGTLADELSSVGSISAYAPKQGSSKVRYRMMTRPADPYQHGFHEGLERGWGGSLQESMYVRTDKNSLVAYEEQTEAPSWGVQAPRAYTRASRSQYGELAGIGTLSATAIPYSANSDNVLLDTRQDVAIGRDNELPQIDEREVIHVEDSTVGAKTEPAQTLEDLLALLKKGYRVKLHNFRGRERAFLYLHPNKKELCLRRDGNRQTERSLLLITSIGSIINLEFGRRSKSGFLLSPLTSFSLAIKDEQGDGEIHYFDLEAASPVQREVLVSTLMIMMDAAGPGQSSKEVKTSKDEPSDDTDKLNFTTGEVNGTFDQPILCSPSLEMKTGSPQSGAAPFSFDGELEKNRTIHQDSPKGAETLATNSLEDFQIDYAAFEEHIESPSNRIIDQQSSGELTDHTSNISVSNTSKVAKDFEAIIDNMSRDKVKFSRSYRGGERITEALPLDAHRSEANDIFRQVDQCLYSGSEDMPIQIDDEMISGRFVQDTTRNAMSRQGKLNRPESASNSLSPHNGEQACMWERTFQVNDGDDWSLGSDCVRNFLLVDDSYVSGEKWKRNSLIQYSNAEDREGQRTAIAERTGLEEMPSRIRLHSSDNHVDGWCSDDVCTGTLNDISKSCTGMFGSEQRSSAQQINCIDPKIAAEQLEAVEEYIATALGAPNSVYTYFAPGERDTLSPMVAQTARPEQGTRKFRNRAVRSNAQANRLKNMKSQMTFAHALKESKEMSLLRTTQSFDDAKLLPKLADNAAQQLHSSPLLGSVVQNMVNEWNRDGTMSSAQKDASTEEESVYYDSDPEDSRPRTMHQGPRRVRFAQDRTEHLELSRPKTLDGFRIEPTKTKLSKKVDEETVKDIVQSMMNERLLVMWHPTQSVEHRNRPPVLARLWIESGVYLFDGSFLLPKLSWIKTADQQSTSLSTKTSSTSTIHDLNKLDLLDICRIRTCNSVDRTKHPFANRRLAWYVETQNDVFLFESETAEERERVVYGLKLVVARLASLLMLRDVRAADEFFGASSNGVPGEAPTWATNTNNSQDHKDGNDVSDQKHPSLGRARVHGGRKSPPSR